jgi:hypothetical protein
VNARAVSHVSPIGGFPGEFAQLWVEVALDAAGTHARVPNKGLPYYYGEK